MAKFKSPMDLISFRVNFSPKKIFSVNESAKLTITGQTVLNYKYTASVLLRENIMDHMAVDIG